MIGKETLTKIPIASPFKGFLTDIEKSTIKLPYLRECENVDLSELSLKSRYVMDRLSSVVLPGSDVPRCVLEYSSLAGSITSFVVGNKGVYLVEVDSTGTLNIDTQSVSFSSNSVNYSRWTDVGSDHWTKYQDVTRDPTKRAMNVQHNSVAADTPPLKIMYSDDLAFPKDCTGLSSVTVKLGRKSVQAFSAGDFILAFCSASQGARTGTYVDVAIPAIGAGVDFNTISITGINLSTLTGAGCLKSIGLYQNAAVSNICETLFADEILINDVPIYYSSATMTWLCTSLDNIDSVIVDGKIGSVDGHYLIITNGVDNPICFNGTTWKTLTMPTGYKTCKTLEFYAGSLVLANLVPSAGSATADDQHSVVISLPGTLDDYTSVGADTRILTDLNGEIVNIARLGNNFVVYSEGDIGLASYVGGDILYTFEIIYSPDSVYFSKGTFYNMGSFHLILLPDGIYAYEGGRTLTLISHSISEVFKTTTRSKSLMKKSYLYVDLLEKRIMCSLARSDGVSDLLVGYYANSDLTEIRWSLDKTTFPIISFNRIDISNSVKWAGIGAGVKWSSLKGKWTAFGTSVGYKVLMFCSSNGYIYVEASSSAYDLKNSKVVTPVFSGSVNGFSGYLRFLQVDFLGMVHGVVTVTFYDIDSDAVICTTTLVGTGSYMTYTRWIDFVVKGVYMKIESVDSFDINSIILWADFGGV